MTSPEPVAFATTRHVRDHCLCFATQRAARALARRFDEAFRPLGITSGQFSLMMGLNRPEPPTMGDLAALLVMDRTTLTANLKPLEKRGLVLVEVDAKDRRARRLSLTEQGARLLAQAAPIWRREHGAVDAMLEAAGAANLRAGLAALS